MPTAKTKAKPRVEKPGKANVPWKEIEAFGGTVLPFAGTDIVRCADGRARVTNGVIGVDTPSLVPGTIGFSPVLLSSVLGSIKADTCFTLDGGALIVECGAFRCRILARAGDLPLWPDTPPKAAWIDFGPEAMAACSAVLFAAADGKNAVMAGVHLEKGYAWGADVPWAARAKLGGGALSGFLPTPFLGALESATKWHASEALAFYDGRVWSRLEGGTLCWSLLPAAEWPVGIIEAVEKGVREAGKPGTSWESASAAAAAERVLFASDETERVVVGTTDDGSLVLRVEGQRGDAAERIGSGGSKAITLAFRGRLLAEALRRTSGFSPLPDGSGAIFRSEGLTLLLMALL